MITTDSNLKNEFEQLLSICREFTPDSFFKMLEMYANRNNVIIDKEQDKITQQHLLPYLGSIKKLFSYLRDLYDDEIKALKKKHKGKTPPKKKTPFTASLDDYPIGYCYPITESIFNSAERIGLQQLIAKTYDTDKIIFKRIYIILDDKFFQNAIQLGSLYVDVANDTFDGKLPKVIVKHLKDVNYKNFTNYEEFAIVAERYLKIKLYPNKNFPEIYELYPLIFYSESYGYKFFDYNSTMFFKDIVSDFKLSEEFKKSKFYQENNLPDEGIDYLSDQVNKQKYPFKIKSLFSQLKTIKNQKHFSAHLELALDFLNKIQEKINN